MQFERYKSKEAKEDANSMINNTPIEIAESFKVQNTATRIDEYRKTFLVVGQDIDLIVLLHQLNLTNAPIYFPEKQEAPMFRTACTFETVPKWNVIVF